MFTNSQKANNFAKVFVVLLLSIIIEKQILNSTNHCSSFHDSPPNFEVSEMTTHV